MPRARPSAVVDRAPPADRTTSLDVQALPARLRAATAEHDQLLGRVARRREALAQLARDTRAAVTHVATQILPIFAEAQLLEEEIHAMLTALAGDPKRPRRMREQIRRVHRDLIDAGIIAPPTAAWPSDAAPQVSEEDEGAAADGATVPSKPRPADRDVLRTLFRRLAEALHPDKVQDEDDKARRTEVMKQVTVAYQEGDYARLVEIERAWATSPDAIVGGADDDVERRLATMDRANAELRTQLKQIEREIRALRASAEGRLAKELKQAGEEGAARDVQQELDGRRQVRDFIGAFRDGKMSFDEFLAGPELDDDEDDLEIHPDDLDLMMVAAMRDLGIDPRADGGRGRGPKPRTSRRRRT